MKKLLLLTISISIITFAHAQNFVGKWNGELNVMGQKLTIAFNISKTDSTYVTKMDSPAQNAFGLPTDRTKIADNRIEIIATGLAIFYQGVLEGDSIVGTFNQNGIPFPLNLKQSEAPELKRPQEPKPPFDYKIEDVTFSNKKDKVNISGTITLPNSNEQHPAVILIAGSGPNDRDETIFGHKPFWVIADYLTRNGIAVLRYDKRGVGKSTGRYETATTKDFAEDAKAAIAYLKSRADIDKSSIGIIGHSEGGIIAPMIASKQKDVKFIVLMAGMGTKGIDLIMEQNKIGMEHQNIEQENIDELLKLTQQTLEGLSQWKGTDNDRTALRDEINLLWEKTPLIQKMKLNKDQYIRSNLNTLSSPWFREFLQINPKEYLSKVKCPVLAINGEKDTQVVANENIEIIKASLAEGGNNNFETIIYPNLNHLFQESHTGHVGEYATIEQTISPEVLSDILLWIKSNLQ